MTLSVSAAARLAGVPRSWLRRALERFDFRADPDGRVHALEVPLIAQAHAAMLSARGHRVDASDALERIEHLDDLCCYVDRLGSSCGVVTPEEARELLEGAAKFADFSGQRAVARALRRGARALETNRGAGRKET